MSSVMKSSAVKQIFSDVTMHSKFCVEISLPSRIWRQMQLLISERRHVEDEVSLKVLFFESPGCSASFLSHMGRGYYCAAVRTAEWHPRALARFSSLPSPCLQVGKFRRRAEVPKELLELGNNCQFFVRDSCWKPLNSAESIYCAWTVPKWDVR